jgi:TRAP-type mannitol/chloroaromatic compound transport system substrate-binding protein
MKPRQVLQAVGVGAGAIAAPAIAQSTPEVKWRLTSGFPKSLDTIYGAADVFAKSVGEATDGTVEMSHAASYHYAGKNPTFALAASIRLNSRQMDAWRRHRSRARAGHDRRRQVVGPYDDEKLGFTIVAPF